jgi:hypothetical protein
MTEREPNERIAVEYDFTPPPEAEPEPEPGPQAQTGETS